MKALLEPEASTRCSSVPARRRQGARDSRAPRPDQIHIGIDWLESVAFGHIDSIGEQRAHHRRRQHRHGLLPHLAAARREGRQGHGAQARAATSRPRRGNSRTPRRRASRSSSTTRPSASSSRTASSPAWSSSGWSRLERRQAESVSSARVPSVRRRDPRDRPGERLPVDRARPRHRVRQVRNAAGRRDDLPVHAARACSSAATRPSGRRTSSGPSSTAHQAAISIHHHCQGEAAHRAARHRHEPRQPQDGHARVELQQRLRAARAAP